MSRQTANIFLLRPEDRRLIRDALVGVCERQSIDRHHFAAEFEAIGTASADTDLEEHQFILTDGQRRYVATAIQRHAVLGDAETIVAVSEVITRLQLEAMVESRFIEIATETQRRAGQGGE